MEEQEKKQEQQQKENFNEETPLYIKFSLPEPQELKDMEERVASAYLEKALKAIEQETNLAEKFLLSKKEMLKMKLEAEQVALDAKLKARFKMFFLTFAFLSFYFAIFTNNPIAMQLIRLLAKL